MPEVILHHYQLSPYSEKIRLALGLKDQSWRSVEIPVDAAPKTDADDGRLPGPTADPVQQHRTVRGQRGPASRVYVYGSSSPRPIGQSDC